MRILDAEGKPVRRVAGFTGGGVIQDDSEISAQSSMMITAEHRDPMRDSGGADGERREPFARHNPGIIRWPK